MNDDAPAVGLVGEDAAVAELSDRLVDAGFDATVTDGSVVRDDARAFDVVVALGERAVADVAVGEGAVSDGTVDRPSTPVVPVGAGAGIRSVPRSAVDDLPAALRDGDWETETHVPLSVAVDGEPAGTAVFDVTLVTAEAARISEYDVAAGGERLDRTRADGVVVATPAGSTDYARRVDAPVLAPGTGVAVAWIAPFRIDPDRWVVRPSALEVRVEREEATVDLHVDDRVTDSVGPNETVSLSRAGPFEVAVLDLGRNRYE